MGKLEKIIRAIKGLSIARFSDTLFYEPELYKAVSNCSLNKIKSLIKSGVDINECSSNGNTPLHKAIMMENIPAVRLLLLNRAQLFIQDKKGKTAYELSKSKTSVQDLFTSDREVELQVATQALLYKIKFPGRV
ncbi:ankyrin repeat domain-containing protein [Wolbachia endosymbiont (group A) of Cheilosia soror]|uniref:ankyrin repeat domain-containing protein n=1 Tax=Wolbachia endosymbiont (group A) of Cheilosia soror TaxID=2953995 RepID=UPI0021F8DB5E|nr:ankyrin repeat domain-containing protein [Wolbachia endosymbiont (group A) of Cheilosia soror]